MRRRYVIGESPVPYWCRALIMPYRKSDGSTGYEFHGKNRDYDLSAGDVLAYDGYVVRIESKKERA